MPKVIPNVGEYVSRTSIVGFTDEDDLVYVPTTVVWRMVCQDDDNSVVTDWATVTATTSTGPDGVSLVCEATITVPASAHAMVTTTLDRERRALIVAADKDTDDEWNEEFTYYVERRSGRS
jgi:hypothetical protein